MRRDVSEDGFDLLLGRIKQSLGVKTDTDMAKALGLTQGSVSKAKGKRQIPPAWLIQIAQSKGISLNWLLFGEPASPDAPQTATEHQARATGDQLLSGDDNRFPKGLLENRETSGLMPITVSGDSMSPDIQNGDIVLVNTRNSILVPGGIFAVDINGMVYLKRVDARPGVLVLSCANPAYSEIEVPIVDGAPEGISIMGKVAWLGRSFSA